MTGNKRHYVRGVLVAGILGLPFLFFAINFVWIAASHWLSSNLPSNWFSGNVADWVWGSGAAGDANAYFGLMLNGVPAALLGYAIRWGFIGSTSE
jgi:hypothetical protein